MKFRKKLSIALMVTAMSLGFSMPSFSAGYKLSSFSTIRSIPISEEEYAANIINFDEFLRIYYYNYIKNKADGDKNQTLVRINREINHLKYSANESTERRPPVILHWTDASNAMGVIRTLFEERKSMKEGIIGVDYVVTEPLLHPDYPDRPAISYSVKFSRSEVATTWFHVPEKFMGKMASQDRKYNKAINIEIVGWRFLPNPNGRTNDAGMYGKKGIREVFDENDTDNLENKYSTYPTVLKLVNYLADKYNFGEYVDNFSEEKEIDPVLKAKGITYLNGPVSHYIKGHGLIALEHTLMFGGDYVRVRHDFTPNELLIFYSDLKKFRNMDNTDQFAKSIETKLDGSQQLDDIGMDELRDQINKVKNTQKKEYLLYSLYLHSEKIDSVEKINEFRKNFDYLNSNDREKLVSSLLNKYIIDSKDVNDNDYEYLKGVIETVRDTNIKEKLSQTLLEKYTYSVRQKGS